MSNRLLVVDWASPGQRTLIVCDVTGRILMETALPLRVDFRSIATNRDLSIRSCFAQIGEKQGLCLSQDGHGWKVVAALPALPANKGKISIVSDSVLWSDGTAIYTYSLRNDSSTLTIENADTPTLSADGATLFHRDGDSKPVFRTWPDLKVIASRPTEPVGRLALWTDTKFILLERELSGVQLLARSCETGEELGLGTHGLMGTLSHKFDLIQWGDGGTGQYIDFAFDRRRGPA